jgi:hypothetical protein
MANAIPRQSQTVEDNQTRTTRYWPAVAEVGAAPMYSRPALTQEVTARAQCDLFTTSSVHTKEKALFEV